MRIGPLALRGRSCGRCSFCYSPSLSVDPPPSPTACFPASPNPLTVELILVLAGLDLPLLPPFFFPVSGTKLSESRTTVVPPGALFGLAATFTASRNSELRVLGASRAPASFCALPAA